MVLCRPSLAFPCLPSSLVPRYVDRDFGADSAVITWLWEWADGLDQEARRKLLLFWSGSSRVPPFGFEDDALNEDHRWAIDKGPRRDECPQVSTW